MKLIIAGSRTLGKRLATTFIEDLVHEFNIGKPDEIVSGQAPGIDDLGEAYAQMINASVTVFPANWKQYGQSAGPIRNQQMAEYGDALLLIWDGKSKGSKNMKAEMEHLNKPVYEVILRKYLPVNTNDDIL